MFNEDESSCSCSLFQQCKFKFLESVHKCSESKANATDAGNGSAVKAATVVGNTYKGAWCHACDVIQKDPNVANHRVSCRFSVSSMMLLST